jgi:hypothetical protein
MERRTRVQRVLDLSYLYVQREAESRVAGVNKGGRHRRVLSGTLHDPIRGETAVGCRGPRAGDGSFMDDKGRNSQRHIRSRVSPCSTVVKRGYRSRRKVRR